jgi:tol-pal system protein YbgF
MFHINIARYRHHVNTPHPFLPPLKGGKVSLGGLIATRHVIVCFTLLFFVFFTQPVYAQSEQSLQSRLNRLERDIQTLSRAVYKGETPPRPAQQGNSGNGGGSGFRANVQMQLSDLEQRLSELTGKYQQSRNRIDKLEQRLETALSDVRLRLNKLEESQKQQRKQAQQSQSSGQQQSPGVAQQESEKAVSAGELAQSVARETQGDQSPDEATLGTITTQKEGQSVSGGTNQEEGVSGDAGSAAGKATRAYEQAFAKLQSGKYEVAAEAFRSYIDNHPEHKLVQNARYWLGESYYARNQYERAARTFADAYQKYPEGKKAADNLLKLGLSLNAMDRKKDACVALNQLKQKFGDTSGPVIRRAEKEIERIGCE